MQTFRKKPVTITAVKYDGTNAAEIEAFLDSGIFGLGDDNHPVIRTLEGHMHVSPGDYVIRGVKGEFYPCKPDIFEQTYEAAE